MKIKYYLLAIFLIVLAFFGYIAQKSYGIDKSEQPYIKVFYNPTWGCCKKWWNHLEKEGFEVENVEINDLSAIKKRYGISDVLTSCHTAIINDYVIEGHVPAKDIKRLLKEKSDIIGLSVPGMPAGSPGMEQGGIEESFNIYAIHKDGSLKVYQRYWFSIDGFNGLKQK